MSRRPVCWTAGVMTVLLALTVTACAGDDGSGPRDPLPETEVSIRGGAILYTAPVDGVPSPAGEAPPIFSLVLGPECLVATVDDAASTCLGTEPGEGGAISDGGIHGDVSAAWAVSGDETVVSARFWMLDGTTFEQQALLADDRTDPPIVFGHAVAATDEIVGIELLDAEGHVVMALSIDPEA